MVSSLIFQKFSGEGLTEPPPQTPPPFFLGLRPRFGLRPQLSGASRPRLGLPPRYSGASRPRFGLRPQLSIGDLGLAPPKINSWIRPWDPDNSLPKSTSRSSSCCLPTFYFPPQYPISVFISTVGSPCRIMWRQCAARVSFS